MSRRPVGPLSHGGHGSARRISKRRGVAASARARVSRGWAVIAPILLAGAVAVGTAGTAQAVPPPPPNPSDREIQDSQSKASQSAAEVGRLSGAMSSTQAKITRLQDSMELAAELAMKARVDLQVAQATADDAEQFVATSRRAASQAGDAISAAENGAAQFAAASFRQGSVAGSLTALLDADSIDELLARSQMIAQVSGSQAGVLDLLRTSRVSKANLDSQAREALAAARRARSAAQDAQRSADRAEQAAVDSFASGQRQLTVLQAQLVDQQATYQQALDQVAELKGQRAQYETWLATKKAEERRVAEQAAVQQRQAAIALRQRQLAEQQQAQVEKQRADAIRTGRKRQQDLARARAQRGNDGGSQPGTPSAPPGPPDAGPESPVTQPGPADGRAGQRVVQEALKWVGTSYAWGGGDINGPTKGIRDYGVADQYGDYKKIGFDCSGLTLYAWGQVGVRLPHYSGYQFNRGQRVDRSDLQPGDLVYYANDTSNPATIHHVAIYMGNDQIIEARQSGDVVRISSMRWAGYIGATRPGT